MKIEIKYLLSLIQYHYEHDEDSFKNKCEEIIKIFDEQNQGELSRYILAQMGQTPSFVPMERKIISKDALVTVNGTNFHCNCGSNVFTHYEGDIFVCHCCGKEYEGE